MTVGPIFVSFAGDIEVKIKVTMYGLQDMGALFRQRIDRDGRDRNVEARVKAKICIKNGV